MTAVLFVGGALAFGILAIFGTLAFLAWLDRRDERRYWATHAARDAGTLALFRGMERPEGIACEPPTVTLPAFTDPPGPVLTPQPCTQLSAGPGDHASGALLSAAPEDPHAAAAVLAGLGLDGTGFWRGLAERLGA